MYDVQVSQREQVAVNEILFFIQQLYIGTLC